MTSRWSVVVVLAILAAAACTDETPTEIGDGLLPQDLVRTYEVVLEPEDYLVRAMAFSGYVEPAAASFLVVANDFEGAFNAHALARFTPPSTIVVRDTQTSVLQNDTMPRLIGGELVVRLDTLRSSATESVLLRVSRLSEVWDPRTVSWQLRIDSGGVHLPWTTPGGTTSSGVGAGDWDMEGDSAVIPIDSLTLRAWQDTADLSKGALIESLTPNTRLRISGLTLYVRAQSSIADTVVTTSISTPFPTFVEDPEPPSESVDPRVGGLPAWRTILQLRDRLDMIDVPCAPGSPIGCTVPLSETAVTYAGLQLQPKPPPAGFAPEDSVVLGALPVLVSNDLPISRAPLAPGAAATTAPLAPSRFTDPGAAPIELPVTGFLTVLTRSPSTGVTPLPPYLALLQQPEGVHVGFVQFEEAPRLRLIITTSATQEIR